MKHISFLTQKPTPTCTYFSITTFLLLSFFYTIYHYNHHHYNPRTSLINYSHFHDLFLSSSTNSTFPTYLRSLTRHPHLAGTAPGLDTARLVDFHFRSLGLHTRTAHFNALLSYPTHSSLTAHFSNGTLLHLPVTEPGAGADVIPPYHAYSPSGSVRAEAVFANYGREEDYDALGVQGVEVEGKIVIVRKGGGVSRGGLVRIAEAKRALGVLMYAERDRIVKGGVERGTVMRGIGDPLSPGWGSSVEGGEVLRVDDKEVEERFPKIPSLPVSFECAEMILRELGGGVVPEEWKRELRTRVHGVGPGPLVLNFAYQGEKKMATIHNVFAIIRGLEEPDRYVLLGNHRDAWTYGAVDPNSGTAALLDIARRYALMMQMGWNPRRSIILCSWDAEEFGMIGSTEWVEQNIMNLGSKAVAYLNVDCAVQGPGLFTGATPQLDDILIEITKKIKDPDSEKETVFETWRKANKGINIQRLSGVDSDFAPFLQHAGVPSVDIYYGQDFPVYHTAFDTYDWMTNFGDPFFQRHVAASGIWGLLALHLADDAIIPFNYVSYAEQLAVYVESLHNSVDESISLHPLTSAIQLLHSVSKDIESNIMKLKEQISGDTNALSLRALNDRLMFAERGFLDADGLPGNRWFKHLVYGPISDSRSKLSVFPGIAEEIVQSREMSKSEGQAVIQHEIWRVARAILRAADVLKGEL